MAVPVAGPEVHGPEVAVGAERGIDQTDALEELGPVEGRHRPHAGDRVADGHVRRGLGLVLDAHQFVGRGTQGGQLFVEPPQRGRRLRVLLTEPLDELHDEGDREGGGLERLEGERAGRSSAEAEQFVGQGVGLEAGRVPLHDLFGQAPEILHQHHPQRGGDGPELADGEGHRALESADEALEGLAVDVAVGVGDEGPGQAEDARVALQGALGELRELAVKPVRKVLADRPQRVVHDVKVVEKPLGGGGERADLADDRGDRAIALEEDPSVVAHARRAGTTAPALGQDALGGEALGVLLQPFGTEEFRADRALRLGPKGRRGARRAHLPYEPQARHEDILYLLYKLWFDESVITAGAGGGWPRGDPDVARGGQGDMERCVRCHRELREAGQRFCNECNRGVGTKPAQGTRRSPGRTSAKRARRRGG